MQRIVLPAIAYVLPVFALGFALGVIRTLWLAPRFGEIAAVLIELPLVIGFAWIVAGRVLRRWPLRQPAVRAAMGAFAFVLLMALELALGLGLGRPVAAILAGIATPAGLIGLAGQIGFAAIPLFQPRG